MGITNVNEQSSAWGAAFRNKPIFFMTVKETEALFDGKLHRNMELQEDTCTLGSNDTYRRQHTTYEVSDRNKGSAFLDMGFLIKDETSSLKGNLSDKKDVDFYNFSIPFMNFQRNYFGVEVYIDMPEGCDYDLTLYDEYGNQVGKAEWDGEGRKRLTVPNWDINTNKYCLKVENGNHGAFRNEYRIIICRTAVKEKNAACDISVRIGCYDRGITDKFRICRGDTNGYIFFL